MIISTVDLNMVSTQKKKQQNKRFRSQFSESDADFMIEQSDQKAQTESRANTADRKTSLNITKDAIQVKSPLVDLHTLEKNIVSKVRSEVGSVTTLVEVRVQDAKMTSIGNP